MDKRIIQDVEQLYHKKIMLYTDLLQCFRKEREALINIALDELWSISKDKETLCSQVESVRQEIVSAMGSEYDHETFISGRVIDLIPKGDRRVFRELDHALIRLKGEIETARRGNMVYINDSLRFLDGMISIIAGETDSGPTYDNQCHMSKPGAHMLMSREV